MNTRLLKKIKRYVHRKNPRTTKWDLSGLSNREQEKIFEMVQERTNKNWIRV